MCLRFSGVLAWINCLFLFTCCVVFPCRNPSSEFTQVPVDGHVGCSQLLAILNKAEVNHSCTCLFMDRPMFSFPLGKFLEVELLGHKIGVCLVL